MENSNDLAVYLDTCMRSAVPQFAAYPIRAGVNLILSRLDYRRKRNTSRKAARKYNRRYLQICNRVPPYSGEIISA
jgi:hypothetical protein